MSRNPARFREATSSSDSRQPRWAAAFRARETLSLVDSRVLSLLVWLPLAPATTLEALATAGSRVGLYQRVSSLRESGLVDLVTPRIQARRSPGLFHLTDLGLAVAALDRPTDLASLVRRHRLARPDLLERLVGVTHLVALYDLLSHVARTGPGPPSLLSWRSPWTGGYFRPTAKARATLTLPARVSLAWPAGKPSECFLIADRGALPLSAYWSQIAGLFDWRRGRGVDCPTLVVATTTPERVAAWHGGLEAVRDRRQEELLRAHVATWEDLKVGASGLRLATSGVGAGDGDKLPEGLALAEPQSGRALPRFVSGSLGQTRAGEEKLAALGQVALAFSPGDREVLRLVGRHPFLTVSEIGVVLGRSEEWTRKCTGRLAREGLLRLVSTDEIGRDLGRRQPVEATVAGLELIAADAGVTLARAGRWLGLAGGGPESPVGPRRGLVRHVAHTLGVNAVAVSFYRAARRATDSGKGSAVVEWRSAAECARGPTRPDAYLMYRNPAFVVGFFIEYDRGTMHQRDYAAKLDAYYEYRESGRFARDYDGFPVILVVGADRPAEENFARAARSAEVGRAVSLRVLVTSEWRVFRDPRNVLGPLGRVWAEPGRGDVERISCLSTDRA